MTAAGTAVLSPYKGLVPFGESDVDALFFFGRERERDVVVANMMASRLTVLYGPTGVGKTSILRAGVVRALRSAAFPRAVVVFDTWSDDPARRLAEAAAEAAGVPVRETLADTLADAGDALAGELYLVLDQLEEYFVYHGRDRGPGSFTEQFPDAVTGSGVRANVLVCLREDALAKLDVFKTRIPSLFSNYLRLDHLDREAARAAIVGPVARFNELFPGQEPVTVEPGLVDAVLHQVETGKVVQEASGRGVVSAADAGRIETPYLQLVMERLWEVERERGSSSLRAATLDELGGAARIVGEHLELALRDLTGAEKETAAVLFHHLVTPSGTKIAHATADLARYASADEEHVRGVVARLAGERILRPVADSNGGNGRYEIFHDVLADAVLSWRTRYEADRELERERAAAGRRHRRLLVVALGALVALAVMTVVSVYALSQRHEARQRSADARVHAREARAGELAATALGTLPSDPSAALRDALRAATLLPTQRTENVLRTVLQRSRLLAVADAGRPVTDVRYTPGGRILAARADGAVLLIDPSRGTVERTLAPGGRGRRAVLAPDGARAAVFGRGAARLVGTSGRERPIGTGVTAASFSGDGTTLATVGHGRVRVLDARTGRLATTFGAPGARIAVANGGATRIAVIARDGEVAVHGRDGGLLFTVTHPGVTIARFSAYGRRFATGGRDGHLRVWSLDGAPEQDLVAHKEGQILAIAFSPHATYVAAGTTDGLAQIWAVKTGALVATVTGHGNYVVGVSFSADGSAVATSSRDGTALISKADTGVPVAVFSGHRDNVNAVTFDATRRRAATASDDGTVRVWDAEAQPVLAPLARLRPPLAGVSFVGGRLDVRGATREYSVDARSGRVVSTRALGPRASRSADGSVVAVARGKTVALRAGARRFRLEAPRAVADVAVSPDGRRVAAATGRVVVVWTARTGARERVLRGHADTVTSVAFSRDGARLVTASRDHTVVEWSARGKPLLRARPHFGRVADAVFSPNGRWIVTAGPITAALVDAETGATVFLLHGHEGRVTGATFDGEGRRIYTVGTDGTVRTYRCEICGGLHELEAIARARLRRY